MKVEKLFWRFVLNYRVLSSCIVENCCQAELVEALTLIFSLVMVRQAHHDINIPVILSLSKGDLNYSEIVSHGSPGSP
jgi:hypothetical protein